MSARKIFMFLICLSLLWLADWDGSLLPLTQAATFPNGFTDVNLFGVSGPTALAFTPDNRLLVATQSGVLRVYQNGSLLATPALTIPAKKICTNSERGMLGIAADPQFANNNYIYLYYTFNKFSASNCPFQGVHNAGPVNRVSRFVLAANNTIDINSETVIIDNVASFNGNHNGGDVHFGADGLLYISVGDTGCQLTDGSKCQDGNQNTLRLDILNGKILRVNKDGTIPASNPKANDPNGRRCGLPSADPDAPYGVNNQPCQEMFAHGLRNPFRFNFKPNSNNFFIDDVGGNHWEEIDNGQLNADYGWNVREGPCATGTDCNPATQTQPAGYTAPIAYYNHNSSCYSITGGTFVPAGFWPSQYDNAYLYSDYGCGTIFTLTPNGNGYTSNSFVTNLGNSSAIDLQFAPYTPAGGTQTRALYYSTYANGGEVHALYYSGAGVNRSPTADLKANPNAGPLPLNVTLDGSGSGDPDTGDTLSYVWQFGDGTNTTSSVPTTTHSYIVAGPVTATLTVKDNHGAASQPTSVRIYPGDSAPVPIILSPLPTDRFFVGQDFNVIGQATDAIDGNLSASAFAWSVIRHHGLIPYSHTHPYYDVNGVARFNLQAPAAEDLESASGSYIEIRLTVTNSRGISTTISQNYLPKLVGVTFDSTPTGASALVNGTPYTLSKSFTSWQGFIINITNLTAPPSSNWETYTFQGWSNGSPTPDSAFTTPSQLVTYNANYLINNCNALNVTNAATNNPAVCGTLPYALNRAGNGAVINLNVGGISYGNTPLIVNKAVTLQPNNPSCATPYPLQATRFSFTGGANLFAISLTSPGAGPTIHFGAGGSTAKCIKVHA